MDEISRGIFSKFYFLLFQIDNALLGAFAV